MWTVIKQSRKGGDYYSALDKSAAKARSVTLGYIPGSVPTATLTARLRATTGPLTDEQVRAICLADTDDDALLVVSRDRMLSSGSSWSTSRGAKSEPAKPKPVEVSKPGVALQPDGEMTLARYVAEVWTPIRSARASTWDRESWWWHYRILPVLGEVRLCDLNARKWTDFLGTLTVGGRSKAIAQNTYRVALKHAVTVLEWLPSLHQFARIDGSTKGTRAKPEPLSTDEIGRLLNAAGTRVHRALIALAIGQGLRPGEAVRAEWEDFDFEAGMFQVRGSKNDKATAKVPMTALTRREMLAFRDLVVSEVGKAIGPCFQWRGKAIVDFKTAIRGAAERAGLNTGRARKVFPYLCRHTFATQSAVSGIDKAFTRKMMRHSAMSTILERAYEQVSIAQTADAMVAFPDPLAAK